jgi:hypothetical protein
MPGRFQMDGYREAGAFIHDLFVHPEVRDRGMGFFTAMKLYRAAEKAGSGFAALVWTNAINIKLQTARRYEQRWITGHVKALALDAEIDRAVPVAPVAAAGKLVARAALGIVDRTIAAVTGGRRCQVVEVDGFDERFDRLADHVAGNIGISPVKHHRYLEWKYRGWPHQPWAGFAAVGGAGITGFAVVVDSADNPTSTVAELVAEPDDADTITALVQAVIRRCRASKRTSIAALATDPRFARVLERHLFAREPEPQPLFLANPGAARNPDLIRRTEAWHLSYGDSEGAL